MAGSASSERDYFKWAFFGLMAACTLVVIFVDERFLITPGHPEWAHIQPFKWLLLFHGAFGATALWLGPAQFSDRLRRVRPDVHRAIGWTYICAVAVAAPLGGYIGAHFGPPTIHLEQYVQSGLWFFCTGMALICILSRALPAHKLWMMRSYGFALVFVLSRLSDAVPGLHVTDQMLADELWCLTLAALAVPDIALTVRDLVRRRRR